MVSNRGMSARVAPQEDLLTVSSGVVEALDPAEAAGGESSPFPALGEDAELADPLLSGAPPARERPPALPKRASPPALPSASAEEDVVAAAPATNERSGHLRLVSEPRPEPEARPEPPRRRVTRPLLAPSRVRSTNGRAFGTNPARSPTPPPVSMAIKAELDEWTPPLRREESVIQEAAALRGGNLSKVKRSLGGLGSALLERGMPLVSRLGEAAVRAIRRFEKLPRRTQIALVAAPYLLAALVALVLSARGGEEEVPTEAQLVAATPEVVAPEPPAAPTTSPDAVAAQAEAQAAAHAEEVRQAAEAKVAAALQATLPTADEAARMSGEARVLPRASALYRRPDGKYKGAVPLSAGTPVETFDRFPAPEGWTLALTQKGTVGYLSLLHLADEDDPRLETKAKVKRKARRRRR